MKKLITCHEIFPGCPFTAHAESEEEILRLTAEHARLTHGIKEISPEMGEQVKAAIRDEK